MASYRRREQPSCQGIKSARSLRFVSVDSVAPFVSVLRPSVPTSIPDYNFRRMKHFK